MDKKPVPRMNQDQKRFLLQELGRLTTWGSPIQRERRNDKPPIKPVAVTRWEKTKASFDAKQSRLRKIWEKQFGAAAAEVRQEIYFGTADGALAKLEAFKHRFR
jgi:hypothetical protein